MTHANDNGDDDSDDGDVYEPSWAVVQISLWLRTPAPTFVKADTCIFSSIFFFLSNLDGEQGKYNWQSYKKMILVTYIFNAFFQVYKPYFINYPTSAHLAN